MSGRDLKRGAAGLHGRSSAAHWLITAALFVLFWTASGLVPARADQRPDAQSAASYCNAVRHYALPRDYPRELEADLPQLVDTASHVDIDNDITLQEHVVFIAFKASTPRLIAQPRAPPRPFARVFNPRAPPPLS